MYINQQESMVRCLCLPIALALATRIAAATVPSDNAEVDPPPTDATTRRLRRPAGITEPTFATQSDLRASPTQRTLQGGGGGFDQNGLIESADSLFCNAGVYSQPFAIDVSIDQTPASVPPEDQCNTACDCKGRCCSNSLYYIDAQSAFGPGSEEGGGGVCVEIPSDITDAASSTCNFGLSNAEAENASSTPPTPTPVSKPGDDQVELSMRRLDMAMTNWLNEMKENGFGDGSSTRENSNVGLERRNGAEGSRDEFKLMRINRVHAGGIDGATKKRNERRNSNELTGRRAGV